MAERSTLEIFEYGIFNSLQAFSTKSVFLSPSLAVTVITPDREYSSFTSETNSFSTPLGIIRILDSSQ